MTKNVNDRMAVEVEIPNASDSREISLPTGATRQNPSAWKNIKLRTGIKAGGGDLDWGTPTGWSF